MLIAHPLLSLLEAGCSPCDCVHPERPDSDVYRRVFADLHVHPLVNDWVKNTPLGLRNNAFGTAAEAIANDTGLT